MTSIPKSLILFILQMLCIPHWFCKATRIGRLCWNPGFPQSVASSFATAPRATDSLPARSTLYAITAVRPWLSWGLGTTSSEASLISRGEVCVVLLVICENPEQTRAKCVPTPCYKNVSAPLFPRLLIGYNKPSLCRWCCFNIYMYEVFISTTWGFIIYTPDFEMGITLRALRCILGRDTLLSQCLSSSRCSSNGHQQIYCFAIPS